MVRFVLLSYSVFVCFALLCFKICMYVCMYMSLHEFVHYLCLWGQQRAPDSLELELQEVVSHLMWGLELNLGLL